jgi:hypothetical protein
MTDWSASAIKLDKLQNKLLRSLNDKKHSEAFSILLEMQGDVLRLMKFVICGRG